MTQPQNGVPETGQTAPTYEVRLDADLSSCVIGALTNDRFLHILRLLCDRKLQQAHRLLRARGTHYTLLHCLYSIIRHNDLGIQFIQSTPFGVVFTLYQGRDPGPLLHLIDDMRRQRPRFAELTCPPRYYKA